MNRAYSANLQKPSLLLLNGKHFIGRGYVELIYTARTEFFFNTIPIRMSFFRGVLGKFSSLGHKIFHFCFIQRSFTFLLMGVPGLFVSMIRQMA